MEVVIAYSEYLIDSILELNESDLFDTGPPVVRLIPFQYLKILKMHQKLGYRTPVARLTLFH